MQKRIVYAATHAWGSPIRVGSHHITKKMARDADVLYLSHPISLMSLFSRADNQLRLRLKLWQNGFSEIPGEHNIHEATWFMPFAPGPNIGSSSSANTSLGWRICNPNPKKLFLSTGFLQPDELWLDTFFQNFWVPLLEPKQLFMRVADHPEYITRMSKALMRAYQESLERAVLIITPTPVIAEYLSHITNSPIEVIPNGVDVEHFSTKASVPKEFEADPKPKVVFIGALAKWIDVNLIKEAAKLCPEFSFYLIGPNHGQQFGRSPANLTLLGSRPYNDIPDYLQHSQAAIAPFDVDNQRMFVESIDAIKLYEYIAAGVPVVATRWYQSERLSPYVITTNQKPDEFASAIRNVIKDPQPHVAKDSFTKKLDWSHRLASLGNLKGS